MKFYVFVIGDDPDGQMAQHGGDWRKGKMQWDWYHVAPDGHGCEVPFAYVCDGMWHENPLDDDEAWRAEVQRAVGDRPVTVMYCHS